MQQATFRSKLKAIGLSQAAFAARLGVRSGTVNRWALGTVALPRYAEYVLELLEERAEIAARLSR